MSNQQKLTPEEVVNINLMLANVRVLSELIHTIPNHRQQLKKYFKDLFDVIKRYEVNLDKLSTYDDSSKKQQEDIYDHLMELTYAVREIVLKPKIEQDVKS